MRACQVLLLERKMTNDTKSYFQRQGTVMSWWYPESREEPLYEHYREQLRWVLEQFDWRGKRVEDVGTGKGRFAISERCSFVYSITSS